MDVEALQQHRTAKNDFFRNSSNSPLEASMRSTFSGLAYYEPNEGAVFTLPVGRDVAPGSVTIQTSDSQTRIYERAGRVHFEIDGIAGSLTLFSTGQPGYFVPFRDQTSGKETYGGGRYLDVTPNADGTVTIDFNKAYNPFCAYNDAYSCPLPPGENWLQMPITAGEKAFGASSD